jgi:hypothetical protein
LRRAQTTGSQARARIATIRRDRLAERLDVKADHQRRPALAYAPSDAIADERAAIDAVIPRQVPSANRLRHSRSGEQGMNPSSALKKPAPSHASQTAFSTSSR